MIRITADRLHLIQTSIRKIALISITHRNVIGKKIIYGHYSNMKKRAFRLGRLHTRRSLMLLIGGSALIAVSLLGQKAQTKSLLAESLLAESLLAESSQTQLAITKRPTLVELFTSQGCSSCPPADAILTKLSKRADVFALSIHVDYWNYIGWSDPFSDQNNTILQRQYARNFKNRNIYTPQIVIDGRFETIGSRGWEIDRLITSSQENRPETRARVQMQLENGSIIVTSLAGRFAGQADIWGILFDRQHETTIQRGENGGRKLVYSHVQRQRVHLGKWNGMEQRIMLPTEWQALDLHVSSEVGIGVIVQRQKQGPVLGTAFHRSW